MIPIALALLLSAPAATAEEGGPREGLGLIEEGTRQLLRDLLSEVEPGLRDLRERFGDLSAYHAPEVLPNGDILIRRRSAPDPLEDRDPAEDIEL